jgi:hypothetical protein
MTDMTAFLILSFAVWQLVEIWHHSGLFARRRSIVESWAGWWFHRRTVLRRVAKKRFARIKAICFRWWYDLFGWLGSLFTCPWCTSVWVGMLLVLLWHQELLAVNYIITGLAISRVANMLNDITARDTAIVVAEYEERVKQIKEPENNGLAEELIRTQKPVL